MCGAGQKMLVQPTTISEAVCGDCEPGTYQSSASHLFDSCLTPTVVCTAGMYVTDNITSTSDKLCGFCDGVTGFQDEVDKFSCKNLTDCGGGGGILKAATPSSDRVCRECSGDGEVCGISARGGLASSSLAGIVCAVCAVVLLLVVAVMVVLKRQRSGKVRAVRPGGKRQNGTSVMPIMSNPLYRPQGGRAAFEPPELVGDGPAAALREYLTPSAQPGSVCYSTCGDVASPPRESVGSGGVVKPMYVNLLLEPQDYAALTPGHLQYAGAVPTKEEVYATTEGRLLEPQGYAALTPGHLQYASTVPTKEEMYATTEGSGYVEPGMGGYGGDYHVLDGDGTLV